MSATPSIVLFDGVCHLCAWAVQFISARDPAGHFQYASLQSETGQKLLKRYGLPTQSMDSFVLVEEGKAYTESGAALRVARRLSGLWPIFYAGIILPSVLRDPVYRFIARHRYRWFGKSDSCMMPSPELRARFLE
ncbi:MAG: thiol-disulfide oxidoreductase DCC family protein [Nitrospira sp.]